MVMMCQAGQVGLRQKRVTRWRRRRGTLVLLCKGILQHTKDRGVQHRQLGASCMHASHRFGPWWQQCIFDQRADECYTYEKTWPHTRHSALSVYIARSCAWEG